jgi:hypothetical protein
MSKPKKLFVVRKYVLAAEVQDAIRREKHQKPDDVWLDDDWKKTHADEPAKEIGFKMKLDA